MRGPRTRYKVDVVDLVELGAGRRMMFGNKVLASSKPTMSLHISSIVQLKERLTIKGTCMYIRALRFCTDEFTTTF